MKHRQLLERANRSLVEAAALVDPTFRLHYHFMAKAQWMNDPSGLVSYGGYYHVFYQHNPYAPRWGSMHWGHARTKDFLSWEHLPVALAPSEEYDLDGCFSGSAVVADGQMQLFYTGVREVKGKLVQVQCRALSSDGIHFRKDPLNPLISTYPPEGSQDFRDPKVWRWGEAWFMALGSGQGGRGKVLLYIGLSFCAGGVLWEWPRTAMEPRGRFGNARTSFPWEASTACWSPP